MSAVAPPPHRVSPSSVTLPPLEAGEHLDQPTFHARYSAMPPGTRAELIGGVVHTASPVSDGHCTAHADAVTWLNVYKASTPGVSAMNDGTTILGDDSEPQPDAALRITAGGQTRVSTAGYVTGCPEFVCEVASSSAAYDLHEKLRDYDRYGAAEYLAVLVRTGETRWFARDATGRLAEVPPDADGVYRSRAFPGLWLDTAALVRGHTGRVLDVLAAGLATADHAAFAADLGGRSA